MGAFPPTETSRYLLADELEISDGTLLMLSPEPVRSLGLKDDILHTATSGDTWFTLAARYYAGLRRPSQFWWAIVDYQEVPVSDPFMPIQEGKQIRIPSRRTLQEIILNESRRDMDQNMLRSLISL